MAGVSPGEAFGGGFMMLFGARMARGCTSGHGITGMTALSWFSIVSVCAMFAMGISFAFILKAAGSKTNF